MARSHPSDVLCQADLCTEAPAFDKLHGGWPGVKYQRGDAQCTMGAVVLRLKSMGTNLPAYVHMYPYVTYDME